MLKTDIHFPRSHDNAVLVSSLFVGLGGHLLITREGKRSRSLPCTGLWNDTNPWPNLPGARPTERFHVADEWAGAMKLADYLLVRLHPDDRDFAFDAFGMAVVRDITCNHGNQDGR